MKVVIFCGGQGLRLRDYSENVPKPMVPVGNRPIIWHLMKYYAHYGHNEFILACGYRADSIKEYFLKYDECVTNDFVLSGGGRNVKLLSSDIDNWKITFVDTGINAQIGERLQAVRKHLGDDEMFMCNYADCLTDAPLPSMIDMMHQDPNRLINFISVRPSYSFHAIRFNEGGTVRAIEDGDKTDIWINGGYMIMRPGVFDFFEKGDDIFPHVCRKLAAKNRLGTYVHDGFWACMDTFKEKMNLDALEARDAAPWQVWKREQRHKTQP
jgi:glucose-1-phosphate cytidylyltransferase